MVKSWNTKQRWTRLLACTLILFFSFACALRDLGMPVIEEVYLGPTETEQAYQDTQDALWETDMSEAYTSDARTREAAYLTASPTASPPYIHSVSFPSTIKGDGETEYGSLEFYDADGDVNRLTLVVIKADNFGGADYDPRPYLIYGNQYNGAYQLYIWCEGIQRVTLRATLYDLKGNTSNSVDFTFECH